MSEFSPFLKKQKELLKKLIEMLNKKFAYVSILGNDCLGKKIKVEKDNVSVVDSSWQERGFVVRVYNGSNYSEYSFDNISPKNIKSLFNDIVEKAEVKDQIEKSIYSKSFKYDLIDEKELTSTYDKINKDEKINSIAEIIKMCNHIVNNSFEVCEYIIRACLQVEYLQVSKIFLSNKKDLEQTYLWANASFSIILNKDDVTKQNFGSTSGMSITAVMKKIEKLIPNIIQDGEQLLNATKPVMGEYDVITSPDVTGLIAHEAFGHGVEMDMFVKNRALAQEYMNKSIASEIVNMHDGATPLEDVSSYFFDDEGVTANNTTIIKNGRLVSGICDSIAALRLKVKPTGNGKRESYKSKVYTRMTTTYFERGTNNLEDMIASIKKGYLISGLYSGMEDPKNWGIQCVALYGKEIIDGKLTGKIVSPIYMSGYVPTLLSSISMASRDFNIYGSGSCGKGYKEWVKNACGGPYLKARVKIG